MASVICVLLGLMRSLFCCVHVCTVCRYGSSVSFAAAVFGCVAVMVMSSAYIVVQMFGFVGAGMSAR